ncbi:hypothetical protein L596_000146 [Steinernema carpocapsae]|uniref:G-protein coupled receptors family 2 profile 2 domain-containing protein n=1 Tax=Steinernema carpocapsae TaxID=34508 RepID=A0A4U8UH60_STECR|nr:hypothetical protein L596_000146 [Steinernema carpocapsae]
MLLRCILSLLVAAAFSVQANSRCTSFSVFLRQEHNDPHGQIWADVVVRPYVEELILVGLRWFKTTGPAKIFEVWAVSKYRDGQNYVLDEQSWPITGFENTQKVIPIKNPDHQFSVYLNTSLGYISVFHSQFVNGKPQVNIPKRSCLKMGYENDAASACMCCENEKPAAFCPEVVENESMACKAFQGTIKMRNFSGLFYGVYRLDRDGYFGTQEMDILNNPIGHLIQSAVFFDGNAAEPEDNGCKANCWYKLPANLYATTHIRVDINLLGFLLDLPVAEFYVDQNQQAYRNGKHDTSALYSPLTPCRNRQGSWDDWPNCLCCYNFLMDSPCSDPTTNMPTPPTEFTSIEPITTKTTTATPVPTTLSTLLSTTGSTKVTSTTTTSTTSTVSTTTTPVTTTRTREPITTRPTTTTTTTTAKPTTSTSTVKPTTTTTTVKPTTFTTTTSRTTTTMTPTTVKPATTLKPTTTSTSTTTTTTSTTPKPTTTSTTSTAKPSTTTSTTSASATTTTSKPRTTTSTTTTVKPATTLATTETPAIPLLTTTVAQTTSTAISTTSTTTRMQPTTTVTLSTNSVSSTRLTTISTLPTTTSTVSSSTQEPTASTSTTPIITSTSTVNPTSTRTTRPTTTSTTTLSTTQSTTTLSTVQPTMTSIVIPTTTTATLSTSASTMFISTTSPKPTLSTTPTTTLSTISSISPSITISSTIPFTSLLITSSSTSTVSPTTSSSIPTTTTSITSTVQATTASLPTTSTPMTIMVPSTLTSRSTSTTVSNTVTTTTKPRRTVTVSTKTSERTTLSSSRKSSAVTSSSTVTTSEIFDEVANVIDLMLEARDDQFHNSDQHSKSSTERILDSIGVMLKSSNDSVNFLTGNNLALAAHNPDCSGSTTENDNGLADYLTRFDYVSKKKREKTNPSASITIPLSTICKANVDRVYYAIYRNTKLFIPADQQSKRRKRSAQEEVTPPPKNRCKHGKFMKDGRVLAATALSTYNANFKEVSFHEDPDSKSRSTMAVISYSNKDKQQPLHGKFGVSWWKQSNYWSHQLCEVQTTSERYEAYCNHLTDFTLIVDGLLTEPCLCDRHLIVLGYVMGACSLLGLLFLAVLYSSNYMRMLREMELIKTLRGNPSATADDAVSLLYIVTMFMFYLSFTFFSDRAVAGDACNAFAGINYWLLLSCLTFTICQALRTLKVFAWNPIAENILYFITKDFIVVGLSYGVSSIVVIIFAVVITDFFKREDDYCWIRPDYVKVSVVVPLSLLVACGFICFGLIIFKLFPNFLRTRRSQRMSSRALHRTKNYLARKIVAILLMQFTLGIPWVFQYLTLFAPGVTAWHYVFTIVNGSQGVSLFGLYLYRRILLQRQKRRSKKLASLHASGSAREERQRAQHHFYEHFES